jgi:hypothetical protein
MPGLFQAKPGHDEAEGTFGFSSDRGQAFTLAPG